MPKKYPSTHFTALNAILSIVFTNYVFIVIIPIKRVIHFENVIYINVLADTKPLRNEIEKDDLKI